ncbi:amidohydrolase family protein [Clostridium boliviensis]|uniref:Amidohydrolase family protein n=1 Tax=Clostridium boliviensis TaxID=318465 RepID=A0ABU4GLG1_9CLOT|nr:amidohydrolase family protein [Clostridium boliviensis]MDW2798439.1 amidohydrolase family protein [Clostridium boliviensis]
MISEYGDKIIDSHVHMGTYGPYEIRIEYLVREMERSGVEQAVISDIGLNSLDEQGVERFADIDTISLNSRSLKIINEYGDRFLLLFWIRPLFDRNQDRLNCFLYENRERIGGLKVHPRTAGVPFNSADYSPYIEVCRRQKIPFCIHTQRDGYSNMEYVYEAACKNPDVTYIAVHMDLGGDREIASDYIAGCPNLYGDTTLVSKEEMQRAIEKCGPEKILFGTDALVFGRDSYSRYDGFYDSVLDSFGRAGAENVFYKNARKLFWKEKYE